MPKFIIEREMPGFSRAPSSALQSAEQASGGVLRETGAEIQLIKSYVAGDKVYCVYLAPDEETIREYAKRSGFPANSVSKMERMDDLTSERRLRSFPRRVDPALAAPLIQSGISTGKT